MNTGGERRFEDKFPSTNIGEGRGVVPTTLVGNLGPEKEGEDTGRLERTLVRLSVGGREA